MKKQGLPAGEAGFTLIELLVVISIIALLASILLASINQARAKARDAKRIAELQEIQKALELYALDNHGLYPTSPAITTAGFGVSCWECNSSISICTLINSDSGTNDGGCFPTQYDMDKLVALSPYMHTRPSDPSVPSSGRFDDLRGYWYKVSTNMRDYKMSLVGTMETNAIPETLKDTALMPHLGNNFTDRTISVWSSETSKKWFLNESVSGI